MSLDAYGHSGPWAKRRRRPDDVGADREPEHSGPDRGYGMGWWVDRESGQISDGGAYGTVPWLDLADGYGVYLVIEAASGLGGRLAKQLRDPIEAAMTAGG